ncbi:hypothetical protein V5F53_13825 [Xanthobacter sp. V4C-4]|uniref:hypothetical protein n=1 Tax=Xanthobacter cornucopiae TaxID=3119924 RepID=UPI00372AA3EA
MSGDQDAALMSVCDGDDYALQSGAGGASYVLRFKAEQMTAHLEGDDAERFRSDFDAVKAQYPEWTCDQLLAQLWDQGGYSWLAIQDG